MLLPTWRPSAYWRCADELHTKICEFVIEWRSGVESRALARKRFSRLCPMFRTAGHTCCSASNEGPAKRKAQRRFHSRLPMLVDCEAAAHAYHPRLHLRWHRGSSDAPHESRISTL